MIDKDTGVALALIERFETQRLPRAQAIKQKVDNGGLLDDSDMAFLKKVQEDAQYVTPLVSKHPEWRPFVTRATTLYKQIVDKALENETNANKPQ